MRNFLTELKRRNVPRVAAAYALSAWIIIEAGSVLLPTFGASQAVFRIYVLVVVAGFVVSLAFNVREAATPTSTHRSVAVLPFTSRGSNPENQLFGDGIHDELLTRLAGIKALKVRSALRGHAR